MMKESPNLILEIANGSVLICALSAAIFILSYIFTAISDSGLSICEFVKKPTMGVRIAAPMLLLKIGIVLSVSAVWCWRFFSPTRDMPISAINVLALGVVALLVSILWMVRTLTAPGYGEWPWIITVLAGVLYVMMMLLFET